LRELRYAIKTIHQIVAVIDDLLIIFNLRLPTDYFLSDECRQPMEDTLELKIDVFLNDPTF
jgi:hypothetical protein